MTKLLYVNSACNNNCVVCFSRPPQHVNKGGALSFDEELLFYGGEPFMNSAFGSSLKKLKADGYRSLSVLSNGRAFVYRRKALTPFDRAYVKLFSSNERTNDNLVRVEGATSQTLRGIKNLIGVGKEVFVVIPVIKQNFSTLSVTISNLHNNFGVNKFILHLEKGASMEDFLVEDETFDYYNFSEEFGDYSELAYSVLGRRHMQILFSNVVSGYFPKELKTDIFDFVNKEAIYYC